MSNDSQKADQIAYRFYTKLTLVLNNARATADPKPLARIDKWFNLETPDSDLFKDHLRIYRSISSYSPNKPPAPFQLDVLLSIPELSNNQVLVHHPPDSARTRIDPTPRYILLESWLLQFTPTPPQQQQHHHDEPIPPDVAPSTIYKHGIPLFRSIYTLLRILPTWNLFKSLRRKVGVNRNGNLSIILRLHNPSSTSASTSHTTLRFNTPPAANTPPLPTSTHTFPSIPHPMGTLSLSTTYLSSPSFQLDELESLLSSRFLSLDEGPEFTPTLTHQQQRGSLSASPSSSPGSLPIRIALPRSPPSSAAVAERFVLPPSRTTSFPGGTRNPHLPPPLLLRNPSSGSGVGGGNGGTGSGYSLASSTSKQEHDTSSAAWSRDDMKPSGIGVGGVAERWRREGVSGKQGVGGGADLPSVPSSASSLTGPFALPMPIRRPGISPVHPFKASTLSSGGSVGVGVGGGVGGSGGGGGGGSPSSLRQPSPLSSVGLSGRNVSVPGSGSGSVGSGSGRAMPPSPIGMGMGRPSPPTFTPSSLGERRSGDGGEGGMESPVAVPRRKRYSSSFGHRYVSSGSGGGGGGGAGSEGSAGSGERKEGDRVGSASFLSANTDDDDISVFVQDIDSRKPLVGRGSGEGSEGEGNKAPEGEGEPSRGEGGEMLTSEKEVDEKLRQMNEVFLASLEGLGGGSRRVGRRGREERSEGGGDSLRGTGEGRRLPEGGGGHSQAIGRGRGRVLIGRPESGSGRSGSGSGSGSEIAAMTGIGIGASSDEIVGGMELDYERKRVERG